MLSSRPYDGARSRRNAAHRGAGIAGCTPRSRYAASPGASRAGPGRWRPSWRGTRAGLLEAALEERLGHWRQGGEGAVGAKRPVGGEHVHVGVEVGQIPEGLECVPFTLQQLHAIRIPNGPSTTPVTWSTYRLERSYWALIDGFDMAITTNEYQPASITKMSATSVVTAAAERFGGTRDTKMLA